MALNFPTTPTTGQEHDATNGIKYLFDGVKWITQGSYGSGLKDIVKLDNIASQFNGTLTTFNLTANSQTLKPTNAESLTISLGGVIQEPQVAYTINTTAGTITFASAPATGTTFYGILNSRLPVGTLNFTQQGLNAISRSVQNKLEEFVSVKDFNAKGDGITDDSTAINAALLAATGKTLYFPAGTYIIGAELLPKTKTTIVGDGIENTIIKASNSLTKNITLINIVDGQDAVTIKDITIDGNWSNRSTGSGSNNIMIMSNRNILERVYTKYAVNAGILLGSYNQSDPNSSDFSEENTITNCIIEDNEGVGLSQSACSGTIISHNRFARNGLENLTIDGRSNRTICTNNRFFRHGGGVGNIGWDESVDSKICDNFIDNESDTQPTDPANRNGICVANQFNGNYPTTHRCIISNNHIVNFKNNGIWLKDTDDSGAVEDTGAFIISNNFVARATSPEANSTDIKIGKTTFKIIIEGNNCEDIDVDNATLTNMWGFSSHIQVGSTKHTVIDQFKQADKDNNRLEPSVFVSSTYSGGDISDPADRSIPLGIYAQHELKNVVKTITEANITEANPGVFTSTAHGFENGDQLTYNSNGGTNLITKLGNASPVTAADGTIFYVVNKNNNTFQIASTSGGDPLEVTNDGNNAQTFTFGATSSNVFTHSIMGYGLNNSPGDNDAIGTSGRARKKNVINGTGDAAGVWGSAYQESEQNGGVMGLEGSIYQNVSGTSATDRLGDKWSTSLHLNSDSTGSKAIAAIGIDSTGSENNRYGYWNAIIIDGNSFGSLGKSQGNNFQVGSVGINCGSWSETYGYPETGIKIGKVKNAITFDQDVHTGGYHLYSPNSAIKAFGNLNVTGAILAQSAGDVSLILNADSDDNSTNKGFIDFQINEVVKGNIAVNEAISGLPLEINSAVNHNIALVSGGGNVGINTNSPTEKLFVNGNIKATGDITAEGSLKVSATGDAALVISADVDSGSADETDTRNLIDFNVDGTLVGNIFYKEDVNIFEFNTNDATPNITRIGCGNGDAKRVQLNSDTFQVLGTRSPASNATGEAGQIAWDGNYVYVCTATNTWKRAALSTY